MNEYKGSLAKRYFWRTVSQQEIDYVEEENGKISAYEFKWNPKTKFKIPKTFVNTYDTEVLKIDRSNFRDFIF